MRFPGRNSRYEFRIPDWIRVDSSCSTQSEARLSVKKLARVVVKLLATETSFIFVSDVVTSKIKRNFRKTFAKRFSNVTSNHSRDVKLDNVAIANVLQLEAARDTPAPSRAKL